MSAKGDQGPAGDERDGTDEAKDGAAADDARATSTDVGGGTSGADVDGAESKESGYRRDDYWRAEGSEDVTPDAVPEPPQGYAFESPEQKAEADDDTPAGEKDSGERED